MNNSLSHQSNVLFWMNSHVWDYLFGGTSKGVARMCGKRHKHRLKKHEAYYDLIQRVCTCQEQDDDLCKGVRQCSCKGMGMASADSE